MLLFAEATQTRKDNSSNSTPWTDFYQSFNRSDTNFTASNQGTQCPDDNNISTSTELWLNFNHTGRPRTAVFCPTPSQNPHLTDCCLLDGRWHCCSPSEPGSNGSNFDNTSIKWVIGVSVVFACCLLGVVVIATFNKCTKILWRSAPDSNQRPKIHLNKRRHEILPVDKRIILKTGNYTVEQSWDAVTIRFYSRDFYDGFKDSLVNSYPVLSSWRDARRKQEARVTDLSGMDVTLLVNDDLRSLLVTEQGALSWVMGDFQTICKNIKFSGIQELPSPSSRPLSPRQATIGEEFFEAGDYNVKLSKTQIEIKFANECLFESFKRTLLGRYTSVPWSKYLQRDCAQIQLDSGHTVTLHLWEDIRSIWLSGDGKKEWYGKEFHEIYSGSNPQSLSMTFTVKTLHMGGYELEFPTAGYLPKVKAVLQDKYPSAVWYSSSCRDEARLPVCKNKNKTSSMLIQIGNAKIRERKIWINGDAEVLRGWLNELNEWSQAITESIITAEGE